MSTAGRDGARTGPAEARAHLLRAVPSRRRSPALSAAWLLRVDGARRRSSPGRIGRHRGAGRARQRRASAVVDERGAARPRRVVLPRSALLVSSCAGAAVELVRGARRRAPVRIALIGARGGGRRVVLGARAARPAAAEARRRSSRRRRPSCRASRRPTSRLGRRTRGRSPACSCALAFASIARLGAWELARDGERAGESSRLRRQPRARDGGRPPRGARASSSPSPGWARAASSPGQLGAVARRWCWPSSLTYGVAKGVHSGAAPWQSILHTALADAPGIPPPYALDAFAIFLVPASLLLALVAAAQPQQVVAVVAAVALALVSRGAFDAPLRALCAVAAAQWAALASVDERAMWRDAHRRPQAQRGRGAAAGFREPYSAAAGLPTGRPRSTCRGPPVANSELLGRRAARAPRSRGAAAPPGPRRRSPSRASRRSCCSRARRGRASRPGRLGAAQAAALAGRARRSSWARPTRSTCGGSATWTRSWRARATARCPRAACRPTWRWPSGSRSARVSAPHALPRQRGDGPARPGGAGHLRGGVHAAQAAHAPGAARGRRAGGHARRCSAGPR